MLRRYYTAYGLVIQSELDFHELLEGSGKPDVALRLGQVPARESTSENNPALFDIHKSEVLLNLHNIAKYWIKNGEEIVIEPAPGSDESEVRLYLFGVCFGILLHQRGILALHASAIKTARGSVLFAGPSGMGKSTLMTAFVNKGYCMLSDDVTGIILNHAGSPIVLPAMPRSKLWSDAVAHLGYELSSLPRLRQSEDKYELNLREHFAHLPVPLSHIYVLFDNQHEELELQPLDRLDSFQAVLHNTYREFFLDGLDKRTSHLKLAAAAARHARVRIFSRPRDLCQMDEVVELLEADFLA